jgi:hypothetical protein
VVHHSSTIQQQHPVSSKAARINGMTRSVKLGVASVVLVAGCVLPSPLNIVFAVISCVLASLAAHRGSKWWLFVPCAVIGLTAVLIYIGFHAA